MDLVEMQIIHTSHQDIIHKKYTSYIYYFIFYKKIVPFLHFETHKFCTNILFHDLSRILLKFHYIESLR
jgi:hypothetical protein